MNYEVPLVAQTSGMSCWAASIAMILGWKRRMSIPDHEIARNPGGPSYMTSYNEGLDPNDRYILAANGFELDSPMCYAARSIGALLSNRGPLWVATWAPGPHIRVITGMRADTLFINDPAPVNVGAVYTMRFRDFFGAMEELGRRESGVYWPVYVAYLK